MRNCIKIVVLCEVTNFKLSLSNTQIVCSSPRSDVTTLYIFNCLFQLLQVYQAKLNYLSWENLIEWITYVTSLLLVIDFEVCQRETGYRQVRITYVTSLLLVIEFEVCQRETGYRQVRFT